MLWKQILNPAQSDQHGAFVSNDLIRVFGLNHGIVHACLDRTSTTDLVNGKASGIDNANRVESLRTSDP